MTNIKPMTEKDAKRYLEQIRRMKVFKALSEDIQKEAGNQKEYKKMVNYLKSYLQPYVIYSITNGRNRANLAAYNATIEAAERSGVFKDMCDAISAGNVDEFKGNIQLMKWCYAEAIREGIRK